MTASRGTPHTNNHNDMNTVRGTSPSNNSGEMTVEIGQQRTSRGTPSTNIEMTAEIPEMTTNRGTSPTDNPSGNKINSSEDQLLHGVGARACNLWETKVFFSWQSTAILLSYHIGHSVSSHWLRWGGIEVPWFDYDDDYHHNKKCNNVLLTYLGRVMHICASWLITIGSDNGLSPGRHKWIIWISVYVDERHISFQRFNDIRVV